MLLKYRRGHTRDLFFLNVFMMLNREIITDVLNKKPIGFQTGILKNISKGTIGLTSWIFENIFEGHTGL